MNLWTPVVGGNIRGKLCAPIQWPSSPGRLFAPCWTRWTDQIQQGYRQRLPSFSASRILHSPQKQRKPARILLCLAAFPPRITGDWHGRCSSEAGRVKVRSAGPFFPRKLTGQRPAGGATEAAFFVTAGRRPRPPRVLAKRGAKGGRGAACTEGRFLQGRAPCGSSEEPAALG